MCREPQIRESEGLGRGKLEGQKFPRDWLRVADDASVLRYTKRFFALCLSSQFLFPGCAQQYWNVRLDERRHWRQAGIQTDSKFVRMVNILRRQWFFGYEKVKDVMMPVLNNSLNKITNKLKKRNHIATFIRGIMSHKVRKITPFRRTVVRRCEHSNRPRRTEWMKSVSVPMSSKETEDNKRMNSIKRSNVCRRSTRPLGCVEGGQPAGKGC